MSKRFAMILGLILIQTSLMANVKFAFVNLEPEIGFLDLPSLSTFIEQHDAIALYARESTGLLASLSIKLSSRLGKKWAVSAPMPFQNTGLNMSQIMIVYKTDVVRILNMGQSIKEGDHLVKLSMQSLMKIDSKLICDFYLFDEAVPGAVNYAEKTMEDLVEILPKKLSRPTFFVGYFPIDKPASRFKNLRLFDAVPEDYDSYHADSKELMNSIGHILFTRDGQNRIVRSGVSEFFSENFRGISRRKPLYVEFGKHTWLEMDSVEPPYGEAGGDIKMEDKL